MGRNYLIWATVSIMITFLIVFLLVFIGIIGMRG